MKLFDLIGLKILRVCALKCNKRQKEFLPGYIVFDDGETYIELEDQDREYHDCNPSAKTLRIYKNKYVWGQLQDKTVFPDAEMEIF